MQINQAQVQKLAQELRLTPQQILQSTILQLTTLALEARVIQELEQNPVLEEYTPDGSDDSPENESVNEEEENSGEDDIDWEDILPQNDDYEPKQEIDRDNKQARFLQPAPRGLSEHLFEQVKLLNLDEIDERIAAEIIWNLDERGYLTIPIENIALGLNVSEKRALAILHQIQTFDPPGVAARDLQECLLIQLKQQPNNGDAVTIVQQYFTDFANRRFENIMRELNWDINRMRKAEETIRKLNPKPGTSLTIGDANYIVPDLIVEKVGRDFIVEVNDTRLPELRLNAGYIQMISNGNKIGVEARNYLKKKIDMAKWFIQAIHQRRITMIRVMKAIIARQREWFDDQNVPLKPMILKDIAEDVGMDISTISRVTNGKYVQLRSGIYELKYFFNEGMIDEDGEEISTRIIKARLKELIETEDRRQPHSDDYLSRLLKKEGFIVARRTVAKYREQLKLPVARLRRAL